MLRMIKTFIIIVAVFTAVTIGTTPQNDTDQIEHVTLNRTNARLRTNKPINVTQTHVFQTYEEIFGVNRTVLNLELQEKINASKDIAKLLGPLITLKTKLEPKLEMFKNITKHEIDVIKVALKIMKAMHYQTFQPTFEKVTNLLRNYKFLIEEKYEDIYTEIEMYTKFLREIAETKEQLLLEGVFRQSI
uniref:Uncharacterized protein n=2 Tax=Clastoptera arizonana TaxID=38151 RepID=A0A1B6CAM2_9HEMI